MSTPQAQQVIGSLGRSFAIALVVGAVLGALGPFGTYERLDAPERFGFWIACIVTGTALHAPAYWLARWVTDGRGWSPWLAVAGSALVAALPMTVMVNGIAVSMLQVTRVDSVAGLYPLVLAISLPAQMLMHLAVLRDLPPLAEATPAAPAVPARQDMSPEVPSSGRPEPGLAPGSDPAPGPPRAAVRKPAPEPGTPPGSRFHARIPPRLGRDLRALEMEDHYLRIHTALGSDLVLMRMGDAVAELGQAEGLRVHRSWWVARSAVEAVERDGKSMRLRLAGGLVVPVARDRQGEVRAAGWIG